MARDAGVSELGWAINHFFIVSVKRNRGGAFPAARTSATASHKPKAPPKRGFLDKDQEGGNRLDPYLIYMTYWLVAGRPA